MNVKLDLLHEGKNVERRLRVLRRIFIP